MMVLKHLRLTGGMLVAGFALATVYVLFGTSTHAFAISGSGIMQSGSWQANGATIPPAVPWSVDTASEFEQLLSNEIWAAGYDTTAGSNYNMYGAAYIIESMLPNGVVNGMNDAQANDPLVWQARADFGAFAALINSYAAAGRINWGVPTTLPAGTRNTMHQCNFSCWDRDAYQNNGGADAHWFRVFINPTNEPSTLIIFTNPDGSTFQIRRECANIVGWSSKLTNLPWSMSGHTLLDNGNPFPGQTINFWHYLDNNGPGNTTTDIWWDIRDENFNQIQGGQDSGTYTNGQEKYVGGKTVNIPGNTPGGTKYCEGVLYQPASSSNGSYGQGTVVCATVQSLSPGCSFANTSPGTFDPADPFTINASVNYASGAAASYVNSQSGFYIYIWDSSWATKYSFIDSAPTSVVGNAINASLSAAALNQAGNFNIAYGISGPVGSIDCHGSFNVSYTPYYKVSGGDVTAGPGFGTACTAELSRIIGKNLGSSAGYFGASGQLGAFALGTINGFAADTTLSAAGTGGSTIGSASRPYALAFSNNGASGLNGANWGTSYGKDPTEDAADNANFCVPDYYSAAVNATPAPTVLSNSDIFMDQPAFDALTSGKTYIINGNLQTGSSSAGNIFFGGGHPSRITLVVNGNVYLNSHMRYSAYNYVSGTTTVDSIPQFRLIVKGNIFVDMGVVQMTGFYVAQPNGASGGNIYTCARTSAKKYVTGDSTDASPNAQYESGYYPECSNTLTVTGSLAAKNVVPLRTGGSWKKTTTVDNIPAEQVIYNPELWMGGLTSASGGTEPFDAITNLPPIL